MGHARYLCDKKTGVLRMKHWVKKKQKCRKDFEKSAREVNKQELSRKFKIDVQKVGNCEDTLLPLSCLGGQSDGKSTPLRDRDRLGNDPEWVPGFLSRCSWMFPERLRNKSEPVGSEEIRQV